MKSTDNLSINTIRVLSAEAINKSNSGHPGITMGAAPIAHTLFSRHYKMNPGDLAWDNRDRFVLSAGHGSMLLYTMMHLYGMGVSMDDIKNFRQWESKTPGHPEYDVTPGVETSTGPLGMGRCQCGRYGNGRSSFGCYFQQARLPYCRSLYLCNDW